MKTLNLAVIGKDVSKSTSPQIHTFIAERMGNSVNYKSISIPEAEFESRADGLFKEYDGFNVTIPYKLSIMPRLEKICGDAKVFGAVNTVRVSDKSGYNTEGIGFELMLKNGGVDVNGKTALVLGAGGAGRSVAKKLLDAGAKVSVYDTRFESCKAVANEFSGIIPIEKIEVQPYFVIVNATGIGMHKTEGISPAGEELLNLCTVAVDLIYTPKKSKFLEIAEKSGKKIINGEAMLFIRLIIPSAYISEPTPTKSRQKYFLNNIRRRKYETFIH